MSASEKVKQQLERLGVSVRGSPRALAVAIALVAFWGGAAHSPGKGSSLPYPAPVPPNWTASAILPPASWLTYTLPPLDPRQRHPPCRTKLGEEAINGGCWFRLDVRPPCPIEEGLPSFEHGGKCYIYALEVGKLREPTTGDPRRPGTVAAPAE